MSAPENRYVFQVSGPTSLQILEAVTRESLRDLRFLHMRKAVIAGHEVELGRIGMSGTLAYEVRGPYEQGPQVYDAIYRAGREYGIERLGWLTYLVNHVEGGFPQGGWTFKYAQPLDGSFADYLKRFGMEWVINIKDAGSYDPTDARVRERTPFEVGWEPFRRYDHDFVGREALEREARESEADDRHPEMAEGRRRGHLHPAPARRKTV